MDHSVPGAREFDSLIRRAESYGSNDGDGAVRYPEIAARKRQRDILRGRKMPPSVDVPPSLIGKRTGCDSTQLVNSGRIVRLI